MAVGQKVAFFPALVVVVGQTWALVQHHHNPPGAALRATRKRRWRQTEMAVSPLLLELLSEEEEGLRAKLGGDDEAVAYFQKYEVATLASSSTAYVRTEAAKRRARVNVICLHGFDSSALEFRRLLPKLDDKQVAAFAVDLLDSGFSLSEEPISILSKRRQIREFAEFAAAETGAVETVLLGASLGGAAAVDYCVNSGDQTTLALVAPQVTIDGTPELPPLMASAGVKVLKSKPLRWVANQMAYADTQTFATDAAIAVGRVHTMRRDWEGNAAEWLLSGGYASITSDFQELAKQNDARGLHFYWGKADKILPPFPDTIPALQTQCPKASFTLYDDCGHVPHLERPHAFADDIAALAASKEPDWSSKRWGLPLPAWAL